MKFQLLTSLLIATATLAWAVPSEINYQGRLTDANGDAVTGDVAMSLKMFDAATDGNEIYSEDIGTVTLDSNGIYSFEFGAAGQSVVSTSELIATTDGSNQVFNATLENLPVDGSVSVSDGTYSWSQSNGSSSSTEFTASVTPSSGAVSAIYLGNTPSSIVDITANYNYLDTTVLGALSSHNSHWFELSVDGTAQSPRERVLSVPFARLAATTEFAKSVSDSSLSSILVEAISTAVSLSTSNRYITITGVMNAANNYIGASTDILPSNGITRISMYEGQSSSSSLKVYCDYSDGTSITLIDGVSRGMNNRVNPFPEKTITGVRHNYVGSGNGPDAFYFFRADTISTFETTEAFGLSDIDKLYTFGLVGQPYPQDRSRLVLTSSSGEEIESELYKPTLVPAGYEIAKVALQFKALDEVRNITQIHYHAYPVSN